MHGYDRGKLIDTETIMDKSYSPSNPRNVFLIKTQKITLDTKKNPNKGIKSFFPQNFKEFLPKNQQSVLLNKVRLYDYRNKIIKLFKYRNIKPSMRAPDAKSDRVKESEQEFDESIGERVKLRRQKTDDKTGDDERLDTTDMPELESEESAEQKRKTEGQGSKVLTPQQMLSRLPISLAQLKAGNNYEKLKDEIRNLLYSLYRSKKRSKTIYEHLINAI